MYISKRSGMDHAFYLQIHHTFIFAFAFAFSFLFLISVTVFI